MSEWRNTMVDGTPPQTFKCDACGREYSGGRPNFCLTCGRSLSGPPVTGQAATPVAGVGMRPAPKQARTAGKNRAVWTAIIIVIAVLVIAGGALAAVLALRGGPSVNTLPTTASQMKDSVAGAQDYLNSHWKSLAPARVKDAPVYSVSAKLDPVANTVGGTSRVLYTNTTGAAQSEIVLRVYANSPVVNKAGSGARISSAKVDGQSVGAVMTGSLLRVPLPSGLATGAEALLEIAFDESIPEVSSGLGSLEQMLGQSTGGGYGVFGHSKNVFDLGYFIPTVASYGPEGWDNREVPALGDFGDFECSYYTVSIDVPASYVVAAPGIAASAAGASGRKVFQFRGGPMRDFSAQASPDYQVSTTKEGETTISSYYLKTAGDKGKKALGFARQAVREYNTHIGYYPYVGLNVCEAPLGGGAGGMEFAGQVQIAEMLYGDLGSLMGNDGADMSGLLNSLGGSLMGDMLEFTVAHEVCHQWWGLTVGSDSLAHPWQDESLTNYCTVLYFRWAHGAEAAKKQLDMQVTLPYSAAQLLGGGGDMVVDTPASGFTNATQYTAIVYSKGALFYQALEKQMGEAAFEKSLRQYYDAYAFRLATPENLVAAFTANGNSAAVASLYTRWILERHADEDIAASVPGMNMLEDLLKGLPGGLDMDNLQDLLKEFMPNGTLPQLPDLQLDNGEPILPI
ncbi:MAG: M1 family metallopeptidase [Candidatus Geothermincolia bacterium]